MTGVDTDLATLLTDARETSASLYHMSYTGDQPDLRKQDVDRIGILLVKIAARAEAELSRLRGLIEGSATDEAILQAAEARCARLTEENASLVQSVNVAVSQSERDAARCARLHQALAALEAAVSDALGSMAFYFGPNARTAVSRESSDRFKRIKAARDEAREALAGQNTPADSHSWNQPLAKLEDGKWVDPFVPADRQEDKT